MDVSRYLTVIKEDGDKITLESSRGKKFSCDKTRLLSDEFTLIS